MDDIGTYVWEHRAWFVAAAVTIKWLLDRHKWFIERKKLNMEVKKLVGEQLEKLFDFDDDHKEADCQYKECSRKFLQTATAPTTTAEQLDEAREQLCAALNEWIRKFIAYFDYHCHVYKDDSGRLITLIDGTVRNVRMWRVCQENLNNVCIIEKLPLRRSPFRITQHTIMPLKHTVNAIKVRGDSKEALIRELDILLLAAAQA